MLTTTSGGGGGDEWPRCQVGQQAVCNAREMCDSARRKIVIRESSKIALHLAFYQMAVGSFVQIGDATSAVPHCNNVEMRCACAQVTTVQNCTHIIDRSYTYVGCAVPEYLLHNVYSF